MEFFFLWFNETAMHRAIKKRNIEIIKLLLQNEKIDLEIKAISLFYYLIKFSITILIIIEFTTRIFFYYISLFLFF